MKTFLQLTMLILLTHKISTCSLMGDFVGASIPESAKFAGAVIVGIVENEKDPMAFMDNDIYLTNAQYYKGCGPSKVKVTGYSQSSMCGIDAPKTGDKVMVFVCRDEEGWKLNRYVAYAGQFMMNEDNMKLLIDSVGDVNTCSNNAFVFKKCGKREKKKVKNDKPLQPPRPVLIEPPVLEPPVLRPPVLRPPTLNPIKPSRPIYIPNNPRNRLPDNNNSIYVNPLLQKNDSNRRNVNVTSRISPVNQNVNTNFPIISKPSPVVLNKGNPLVTESSGLMNNNFNSFFSSFFKQ